LEVAGDDETLEQQCVLFVTKARNDESWVENCVLDYLDFIRQRVEKREITGASAKVYIIVVKLFCETNKINGVEWKWLMGGLPRGSRSADDRPPTLEELRKIIEYPDRRMPSIITTMASSGIRIGAWEYLKWGHIEPIYRFQNEDGNNNNSANKLVAAKLRVYVGEPERYTTFITPEAYIELEKWMNFRKRCGENITKESWVMRTLWDTAIRGAQGDLHNPVGLSRKALSNLIVRAEWAQGVRTKLAPGIRRHEFKEDHGFRKFFRTRAEHAGMRPSTSKMLMGHSLGIDDSYFKPTEEEMLQDYLKAVPSLTVGDTITEDKVQMIAKAAAIKATEVAERKLEVERERHYKEFEELKKEQEKLKKMFDAFRKTGQVKVHPVEDEEVAQSGYYYHQSEKR
jgi:integrase